MEPKPTRAAAVVCPVCGDNWDITELQPTATHCGLNVFPTPSNPAQAHLILYWCPCGCVWAPEDTGRDGDISWHHPQVIFDQRPPKKEMPAPTPIQPAIRPTQTQTHLTLRNHGNTSWLVGTSVRMVMGISLYDRAGRAIRNARRYGFVAVEYFVRDAA